MAEDDGYINSTYYCPDNDDDHSHCCDWDDGYECCWCGQCNPFADDDEDDDDDYFASEEV